MAVLAGQRVLVSVCGSDPPDAGHMGARPYEPPQHQTSDVSLGSLLDKSRSREQDCIHSVI